MAKNGKTKQIRFKYLESDGSVFLGVPEEVSAVNGGKTDGGCKLNFRTSPLSIGLGERFSLYLFAGDIRRLTLAVWEAYLQTEPDRARKDFEEVSSIINQMK